MLKDLCVRTQCCIFASYSREYMLFIRLVVNRFKVKIMLLDFQTTVMLLSVAFVAVLSVITLMHTNIR